MAEKGSTDLLEEGTFSFNNVKHLCFLIFDHLKMYFIKSHSQPLYLALASTGPLELGKATFPAQRQAV